MHLGAESAASGPQGDEQSAIAWLTETLGSGENDEIWVGDDAAVISVGASSTVLFANDLVVEGQHFERALSSMADVGWKVLACNVSDIAAMGGRPLRAVVGVVGARGNDLHELYAGLQEASVAYECPVVGGDLSDGTQLVVSVAMIGVTDGVASILRSGARPGDVLFVTGALGRSAAGLRLLRADPTSAGPLIDAHRRPEARIVEGRIAAAAGARSMIDLSDGLGLDLHRLADASGVGFTLDRVPVAAGANITEAIAGGEDFELLFSAPSTSRVIDAFARAHLPRPIAIGEIVEDRLRRELAGQPFKRDGYQHRIS